MRVCHLCKIFIVSQNRSYDLHDTIVSQWDTAMSHCLLSLTIFLQVSHYHTDPLVLPALEHYTLQLCSGFIPRPQHCPIISKPAGVNDSPFCLEMATSAVLTPNQQKRLQLWQLNWVSIAQTAAVASIVVLYNNVLYIFAGRLELSAQLLLTHSEAEISFW